MAISGLDSILANQAPMVTSETKSSVLGKDAFLKLLITQLQYQDPMNPVENTEFTSQLAQFSQLELLNQMGTSMEQLSQLQGSINNIQALSFIGKQVSAIGNVVEYTGNQIDLGFDIDENAADVTIGIFDKDGAQVKTIAMGPATQGNVHCLWDGKDDAGNPVANGQYQYRVQATNFDGKTIAAKTYATGTVTGVRYDKGTTYLIIGDKEFTISDVEKILG